MDQFWKSSKTVLFVLALGALLLCLPRASAQKGGTRSQAWCHLNPRRQAQTPVCMSTYLLTCGSAACMEPSESATKRPPCTQVLETFLTTSTWAWMGAVEVRYNRVIIPVDFIWMKLSDDKSLLFGQQATSIKAKMTETLLTPKIGYRNRRWKTSESGCTARSSLLALIHGFHPAKKPGTRNIIGFRQLGGCHCWWQNHGLSNAKNIHNDSGRCRRGICTIGLPGGRISGGYRISHKCVMQAGYRYLSVNYRPNSTNNFVYDLNMPGLLVGATINLK